MTKLNARELAAQALFAIYENSAWSESAINKLLIENNVSTDDRSLATRICYGVLQNDLLCDWYIDYFTKGKKINNKTRIILRIGVYQLLLLDKIPESASVNTAVELAHKYTGKNSAGFTNAVLRNIARVKRDLPEIPKDDIKKYLSIKYSHPQPLVGLFIKEFGEKFTEKLLIENNKIPKIHIRVNTLKVNKDEILNDFSDNLMIIENTFAVDKISIDDKKFKNGNIYVQDLASQMPIYALNPSQNSIVTDVCAAPGGKSFLSAQFMNNKGIIHSFDIYDKKIEILNNTAKKLGIDIINAKINDGRVLNTEFINSSDFVICDVPCSGFGIIRKKPEIRNKDINEIKDLPKFQLEILENTSKYVKPGGSLVYSTCTILKRENYGVIRSFLQKNNEFYEEEFTLPLENTKKCTNITLYPHINGTDGFFIAKLRRKNDRN